ncbi:MAG: sodium:proton antiporter NhaD [Methylococcaceae bacterium]|jgi:Na+/H+ antiporter NhaD/arsenite permease-like protein
MSNFLIPVVLIFFPILVFADTNVGGTTPVSLDLTHHLVGYISVFITIAAYIAAMSEEVTDLRKSKPMVLGSALAWFAICIYYAMHGQAKLAAMAFENNLLAYIELFLFVLVSMTYLNTMEERGVFRGLQMLLLSRKFSYRQLFWITGSLAFLLSTVINGLTVGLLMGSVAYAVGKKKPEFVSIVCVHIVSATNAGGTFSPLGGISTLFVWQHHLLDFTQFFYLALPCLVNFLLPASIMHFWVPNESPEALHEPVKLKRGSKRIIFLFMLTLGITVSGNVLLELPPAAGMMMGLGLLQFFNFYITKTTQAEEGDFAYVYRFFNLDVPVAKKDTTFDVFKNVGHIDWDTLLFFYGAMMLIGAIGFVGYLDNIAEFLFGQISPTLANTAIGLSSAFIDNGTLMFAVLNMHPAISSGQWLLLTLTLGVGGSLLAIGSAPGVGMLGHIKGYYTFTGHLRWFPVILLGYFASIAVHLWLNARFF